MIRYRFRTTVRYVSLLAIVHICVLFFFGVRLVSNQIAEDPESLFPYDYVFLANETDEELLGEFQEACDAELTIIRWCGQQPWIIQRCRMICVSR
mgnify:CR=1 FL=1